jgi:hypothetical protein
VQLPTLTLDGALFATGLIAGLGIAYGSVELYVSRVQLLEQFFDWRLIRTRYYLLIDRPVLSFVFDLFLGGRAFLWLVVAHGAAALLFPWVFTQSRPAAAVLAGFVLFVHGLTNVRFLIGRDGADQMQTIVWAGLFLACLPVADWARSAAGGLIAGQLVLSYLISGLAKAMSPVWRSGSAIALITRMATYCPHGVAAQLTRPLVSRLISWSTIAFEVGSPALLLGGPPGALVLITMGGLFHIGIAIAMGLTTFVFAFVSTFPLLYHFAGMLR